MIDSMKFTVLLLPDNDHYNVMHDVLISILFMPTDPHNDNEEDNEIIHD
jgi:hypothetical protein